MTYSRTNAASDPTSAPADYTVDQYLPDIEDNDPAGRRDLTVPSKLGSALFAELGVRSPVPVGAFFDGFPISLVTTSTLGNGSVAPMVGPGYQAAPIIFSPP